MITTEGKTHIKRYLAGITNVIGEAIALGIGDTAESESDTELVYEFARVDVSLVSYDFANDVLVFKAEIPSEVAGKIYEVGLWSAEVDSRAEGYSSRNLVTFDSESEEWSTGTWETSTTRIGPDSLRLAPALNTVQSSVLSDIVLDLSGHSGADTFEMAYHVIAVADSIEIRFRTDDANYYSWVIASPSTGYTFSETTKGALAATGSPNWANITSIEVIVDAPVGTGASVDFDSIRVNDVDTDNPDYIMVAREVLPAPHVKTEGIVQDIEFAIPVAIS